MCAIEKRKYFRDSIYIYINLLIIFNYLFIFLKEFKDVRILSHQPLWPNG